MGSTGGGRRRPQKYPEELRERAVRMMFEVREQTRSVSCRPITLTRRRFR